MEQGRSETIGIVVVAAGRGERAGASVEGPKQYRRIGGKPVIWHTLNTFLEWPRSGPIAVVIHPDDRALIEAAVGEVPSREDLIIVTGGATRQASVLNGLRALRDHGIDHVMIQDGVRPFVDAELLERIASELAAGKTAVLPALPVSDTIKRADASGVVAGTVPRKELFAAQTPQSFHYATILDAHERAAEEQAVDFTDDASIAEWAGLPVHLVEGSIENVKLTVQRDIAMADEKLRGSALPDVRTGNGYDVHQLEPGEGVTLCGIFIPHDQRLKDRFSNQITLS